MSQVPSWGGCVTGAKLGWVCHRCQAGVGVSQVPGWGGCVTGAGLEWVCHRCRAGVCVSQAGVVSQVPG